MTAAYGCCGQALTRFTGHPCTGPGRRRRGIAGHASLQQAGGSDAYTHIVATDSSNASSESGPSDEHPPASLPVFDRHKRAEASRRLLVRIVRIGFVVLFLTVTLLAILGVQTDDKGILQDAAILWFVTLLIAAAVIGVALAIDYLTPQKKISTLFSVFVGLLAAVVGSIGVGFVIDLLIETWISDPETQGNFAPFVSTIKVLIGITLSYLAITTVLQTQDDFRLVIPYVEFAKQMRGPRPLLLDTSALIDARILDLGDTGLIQAPLVIPGFVILELQTLSDSTDKLKRQRGRRGLDVIAKLQRSARLDVTVDETPLPGKAVDQMLVELARQMPAMIVTTDTGLARVASIQGIGVLNLNDVANALKPSVLPGERLRLKLIKRGEQPGQAVGYLDDGTMVVAENGGGAIGDTVELTITSSMQTSAGRLIFGRIAGAEGDDEPSPAAAPAAGPADAPPSPAPERPRVSARPRPASPRNPRR